jgi:hypothetical protein
LEAFYLSWREKHIGEGILLKVKGKTYRWRHFTLGKGKNI